MSIASPNSERIVKFLIKLKHNLEGKTWLPDQFMKNGWTRNREKTLCNLTAYYCFNQSSSHNLTSAYS